MQTDAAEKIALSALQFLSDDGDRLERFIALSGLDPSTLRSASRDEGFLQGVLEFILTDEPLLLDFADNAGIDPNSIGKAHYVLVGPQETF